MKLRSVCLNTGLLIGALSLASMSMASPSPSPSKFSYMTQVCDNIASKKNSNTYRKNVLFFTCCSKTQNSPGAWYVSDMNSPACSTGNLEKSCGDKSDFYNQGTSGLESLPTSPFCYYFFSDTTPVAASSLAPANEIVQAKKIKA